MNLISLFIMSFLTQNIVLTKFLGICPFMGTSDREKKAFGMGVTVFGVVMVSSILTYALYYLLLKPTNTMYLKTLVFILVIACMVQIVELLLKKHAPKIHESLGIYLPLITTNCAVLGITLLNVEQGYNFLEMLIFSLGSSFGFTLVIYLFATIRERLDKAPIPISWKGYPIAFLVAAIMAMVFGRFMIG